MWRIGINTWAWVAPLTDQALAELAPRIRDWGFDAVEMPVQGEEWDPQAAGALLADLNRAGISVKDLNTKQSSLEDIFVTLVEEAR